MWLAPVRSIRIQESSDFQQDLDVEASCGCGTVLTTKRTYAFKIIISGGGSLASAWSIYNRIKTELNLASCSQLLLRRRVYDETEQVYKITKASLREIDVLGEYLCERLLTLDMKLTITTRTDNPIMTIYEQAWFPIPPTFIINPWEPAETIYEQVVFPEPS